MRDPVAFAPPVLVVVLLLLLPVLTRRWGRLIAQGISGNDHAFWSIANARRVIGYEPEDNSALRFAAEISEHVAAAQSSRL